VTVIEQEPADDSAQEPEESVTDPVPPTTYQTMLSPETDPVKSVSVAVQVIEEPTATDVAEQTLARLVLALIVN